MTVKTPEAELKATTAELETIEAPAETDETLTKALADLVDRLAKGDFGNTAAAHNGNAMDKSAPMGSGDVPEGYKDQDAEKNVDDAPARVKRSQNVKTPVAAPATVLEKGDRDEGDDDDQDQEQAPKDKKDRDEDESEEDSDGKDNPFFAKKKTRKSQARVTKADIFNDLATGDGADDFIPLVESSDALDYLTTTFAKSLEHLSSQIVALSDEVHGRLDEADQKSAVQIEATTIIAKSLLNATKERLVKSQTVAAKPAVTSPASGTVVVLSGEPETVKEPATDKGTLMKSLGKAFEAHKIDGPRLGHLMSRLDTKGAAAVWEIATQAEKDAINAASTPDAK